MDSIYYDVLSNISDVPANKQIFANVVNLHNRYSIKQAMDLIIAKIIVTKKIKMEIVLGVATHQFFDSEFFERFHKIICNANLTISIDMTVDSKTSAAFDNFIDTFETKHPATIKLTVNMTYGTQYFYFDKMISLLNNANIICVSSDYPSSYAYQRLNKIFHASLKCWQKSPKISAIRYYESLSKCAFLSTPKMLTNPIQRYEFYTGDTFCYNPIVLDTLTNNCQQLILKYKRDDPKLLCLISSAIKSNAKITFDSFYYETKILDNSSLYDILENNTIKKLHLDCNLDERLIAALVTYPVNKLYCRGKSVFALRILSNNWVKNLTINMTEKIIDDNVLAMKNISIGENLEHLKICFASTSVSNITECLSIIETMISVSDSLLSFTISAPGGITISEQTQAVLQSNANAKTNRDRDNNGLNC